MKKENRGFTLIELVIVIAVLGILAIVAIPRFINVTAESHTAVLNELAADIRLAVMLVQGKYRVGGSSGTTVTMDDGTVVTVTAGTGLPISNTGGIDAALKYNFASSGLALTSTATTAVFAFNATCSVTYSNTTGIPTTLLTGC